MVSRVCAAVCAHFLRQFFKMEKQNRQTKIRVLGREMAWSVEHLPKLISTETKRPAVVAYA